MNDNSWKSGIGFLFTVIAIIIFVRGCGCNMNKQPLFGEDGCFYRSPKCVAELIGGK